MAFRNCLLTGLLVSAGIVGVTAQGQGQNEGIGLHSLFVASGKLFWGTATDTNLFNDEEYLRIANDTSEFGMRVPENSQKWQPTEPTQGDFAFQNPDMVALTSRENGQILRCHTLTWHSQLPDFVSQGVWTRETLTTTIQTHIANVMDHFRGQCYSWDVVNEALNDNGTFRDSVFFKTLGTDFLPISFAAAAAADPAAKLYYNDFNLETSQPKADAAVGIVKLLQTAGVRIDGLGFQAHLNVGQTPNQTALMATLNRFTSMGLDVAYTELDIAHTQMPPDAAAIEAQAQDYVNVVNSCLGVPKCVGIVVWEFTDKYSWIPSTFPGKGDACMYDANFNKKPAYTSVSSLLAAAATGGVMAPGGTQPGGAAPFPTGTGVPNPGLNVSAAGSGIGNQDNGGSNIAANDAISAAVGERDGGLGALMAVAVGSLSLLLLL